MTDPTENPKTCKDWTEVTMPAEIKKRLLHHNQLHFGQAKGTPLTIAPLEKEVNFSGTTIYCQLILDGNSSYKGQPEGEIIMDTLKQSSINAIPPTLTASQFDGKIQNWPEETTTSPSNRHSGLIHALYKTFLYHDDDDYKEIDNKSNQIKNFYVTLLIYALKHGYAFTRWKKIINFLLEKDPRHPKIHRLRVIHILE